ncbi:Kiwa anti-phage protein KwaB-like domain-containing protein [Vibrio vulnificus]|uniref:Kiwa anti-phage protein KwaB-like domain-containing protein n=1 Tax=Vibrio vulnificus TaxID=672 RepID=UPI0010239A05|nr:Kiwa anti-phage protein KwaB-like domain-containing protein [Vibrio vulnificus]EHH0750531.1 DUF4868 domain-containing protein [Vibrio vulnificus]EIU7746550.1 DUF4868 domain-containing protein [Vibrio vulnificus]EJN6714800.1 DUF4868 domain-containing protein [Vibrio vulnificus]EKY4879363.1 DUF4868 domain-containing protein [Vibrio vulnificus]ELK8508115.1 DUF4868 domain-containing protein [Vibrio vulnificus]
MIDVQTSGLSSQAQMSNNAVEQAELQFRLDRLKGLALENATARIYVVKTNTGKNAKTRFGNIKELSVSPKMLDDLSQCVTKKIEAYQHIIELKHIHTVQDNRFFHVPTHITDFTQVVDLIPSSDIPMVTTIEELNKYNSYVVRITFKNADVYENLWGFHYFAGAWSAKQTKSKRMSFDFMANALQVDIDVTPVFTLSEEVDYIEYDGDIFICNVGTFETTTNYQERLKEIATSSINNLFASQAMKQTDKLKFINTVGNDKHLMRQIASVEQKAHYKNELWMNQLKKEAENAKTWKIKFENNRILIEEDKEYIKEVLTLLQNKRVMTVVDKQVCDVDGELIPINQ